MSISGTVGNQNVQNQYKLETISAKWVQIGDYLLHEGTDFKVVKVKRKRGMVVIRFAPKELNALVVPETKDLTRLVKLIKAPK